jgi:hypothetical protein
MSQFVGHADASPTVAQSVVRRWRLAGVFGLVAALALAAFGVVVIAGRSPSRQPLPAAVLRATRNILPGTTIRSDELEVAYVLPSDTSLVGTWMAEGDRKTIINQVAVVGVPAGHLIPSEIVAPQITAGLWQANVPIKRMPSDIHAGDHVALLVQGTSQGQSGEFVFMQDVEVISVGSGAVDLWLPAKLSPQVEWYADHGGIILLQMQPGAVQQGIPAAVGG